MNDIINNIDTTFGVDGFLMGINILLHADDALVLATTYEKLQQKLIFVERDLLNKSLKLNTKKCKFMCIGSTNVVKNKTPIILQTCTVNYTMKEKYLGCYFQESGEIANDIDLDFNAKNGEVYSKFNNFLVNNKLAPLWIKSRVLESCFTTAILYGCECWGSKAPLKYINLYNYAIKRTLGIRRTVANCIAFMELKPKPLNMIIISRQRKFLDSLNDKPILNNLFEYAKSLNDPYTKYYHNLKSNFPDSHIAAQNEYTIFYDEMRNKIINSTQHQSKLQEYKLFTEININSKSLSWKHSQNELERLWVTRYVTSSHNLQIELGRWSNTPQNQRICKICQNGIEDLNHFLFTCAYLQTTRRRFNPFPQNFKELFEHDDCAKILFNLHITRDQYGR